MRDKMDYVLLVLALIFILMIVLKQMHHDDPVELPTEESTDERK